MNFDRVRTVIESVVRIPLMVGFLGFYLLASALDLFMRHGMWTGVAIIFAVFGVQFLAWSLGFRSQLLGNATDIELESTALGQDVRQLNRIVEKAELETTFPPSRVRLVLASEAVPRTDSVSALFLVITKIEALMLSLYQKNTSLDVPASPARAAVTLQNAGLISIGISRAFRELWSVRNRILHEGALPDEQQLRSLLDSAERLYSLLSESPVTSGETQMQQ